MGLGYCPLFCSDVPKRLFGEISSFCCVQNFSEVFRWKDFTDCFASFVGPSGVFGSSGGGSTMALLMR